METGSDVFATLTWGLRRYVVLVLAMMLALGVLVPLLLSQRADVYQATAQVGPHTKLQLSNADPLPRIAESVFNNGAVEVAVRKQIGQPKGNIIPSKVRLIAAQDNLVLEVQAHASTPEQAILIANTAAETFVIELGDYDASVAPFILTHQATFAKKVPKIAGGYASVALGLVAGLLAGVALVGLVLVIRRPVVEISTARDVTGSPVIGRIRLPRRGPQDSEDRAIGLLCRRLLTTSASTIHVAAPHHAQAEQLAAVMNEVFGRMPPMPRPIPKRPGTNGGVAPMPKVMAPEKADDWICAPDDKAYTLLLAPQGISTRSLRLFAEAHDTGAPTGIVLVTTHRGHAKPKPAVKG
ncbi:MAG TPA: hypothetical protein VHR85_09485 [Nocardioides sp.]|nr:hypothetical protein [Nocardioides sp.]